jgi:hypothetical protein
MKISIALALIGMALVGGLLFSRATVERGIPRDRVHELLRGAGDSAVTAFRSSSEMADFVAAALKDTVEYYDAEVRAAARIVVRRDTVHQVDTVHVEAAVASIAGDTATLALPEIRQDGIAVAETLTVAPQPSLLLRAAHISFEPDTILAALLRTPEGIDRFSAAAVGTGRFVSIADAAQLERRGHRTLNNVIRGITVAGCVATGIGIGQENSMLMVGGGAVCTAGFSLEVFGFR